MPELKLEVTSTYYVVRLEGWPVDIDDLDAADDVLDDLGPYKRLCALGGIDDVDWSGFYGNNVYFRADSDEARDSFVEELRTVLEEISRIKAKAGKNE